MNNWLGLASAVFVATALAYALAPFLHRLGHELAWLVMRQVYRLSEALEWRRTLAAMIEHLEQADHKGPRDGE